ncbi:cupin domain-containing protein [Patescibacteria group bacterium]
MSGFIDDIEKLTKENKYFRKVLYTGKYSQLVLMCLKPGEEIGKEVHDTVDQFFRIDEGEGEVTMEGHITKVSDGFAVVVPAGSEHNIVNTGDVELKLYTIYSPANHPSGTVHKSAQEAAEYEKSHH